MGKAALTTQTRAAPLGVGSLCGAELPTHLRLLPMSGLCLTGKPIVSALTHGISGFLSHSSIDCALTEASLLYFTKDLRLYIEEIHMEKQKFEIKTKIKLELDLNWNRCGGWRCCK